MRAATACPLALLLAFAACGDDPVPVPTATLTLALSGLQPLGPDFLYEGWILVDDEPHSTGRFTVDASGVPAVSVFDIPAGDLANASTFVLTIEPALGDVPAPAATHLLAGDFAGDAASLTVGHGQALGDDFTGASGSYSLQTPTTADSTEDYAQGIWWLDPAAGPGPSLSLPSLPSGWAYEGWVVLAGTPVSTGRFTIAFGSDSDGAGPAAGPDAAPSFPGQDFIAPPRVLLGAAVRITVEPQPDNDSGPFTLTPLVDDTVTDAGAGGSQTMAGDTAAFPAGTATR
jgi:hypothetical protein